MSTEKNHTESSFVIIRAFGDEPVRLQVVKVSRKAVFVTGTDASISMPFHIQRAYRFDHELYRKMRTEYEAGHRESLIALWETATRFSRTKK
jgi:hypothetical protein